MNIKNFMRKLNIGRKKTTLFVFNTVYDEVADIMKSMGIEWTVKSTEPKMLGDTQIWVHEVELYCTKEEYRDFYIILKQRDLGSDIGFVGYGM